MGIFQVALLPAQRASETPPIPAVPDRADASPSGQLPPRSYVELMDFVSQEFEQCRRQGLPPPCAYDLELAMGLDPTFSPPTRRLARLPVAHAHGFRALLLAPFQKALRLALNALRPDFACKAVDR